MINRLLASYLKGCLLPYSGRVNSGMPITRLVGLVKTVETDRFTKPKVSRFPVSVDPAESRLTDSGLAYPDLVPNQKERLVVYFEDNGAQPSGIRWSSRIRLVAWGNSAGFDSYGRTPDEVIATLMQQFMQALTGVRETYQSPISALSCKVVSIPEAGPNLFSRYTYLEPTSQYLMPPYFAFGLDLQLTYVFKHACADSITTLPIAGC